MNFRALLRRAFPYIVIGIGGFALAYVVMFVFVLPSKIVPSAPQTQTFDTATSPQPIDTGLATQVVQPISPPIEPSPVAAQITETPPDDTVPILTPDLVGMTLPDARGVLNRLRLRVAVTRDTSSFQPPNTVLRQTPLADSLILVRGTVSITVSYFPPDSTSDTMRLRQRKPLPGIAHGADTADRPDTPPSPDTLHPE
ncbi:MAG: PASTA domain-containing protein [Gemmatimonadaceae bacterium]